VLQYLPTSKHHSNNHILSIAPFATRAGDTVNWMQCLKKNVPPSQGKFSSSIEQLCQISNYFAMSARVARDTTAPARTF
jgi:hypothetical protein